MSSPSVLAYVRRWVDEHDLAGADVLEVGAFDVNGSPRPLFSGGRYEGVDARPGPGVDRVADAAHLPYGDAEWDVVVSTEMLEHSPTPWLDVPEMARVLCPGGWLIVTARAPGFPVHDYPSDYWRFSPEAMRVLLALAGVEVVHCGGDPASDDPTTPWAQRHLRGGPPTAVNWVRRLVCRRIGHTRDVRSPWWNRRCRRCGRFVPQSRPLDLRQNGRRPVSTP